MKAARADELARLALLFHVTPAQLRECTVRELRAMKRLADEIARQKRKRGS